MADLPVQPLLLNIAVSAAAIVVLFAVTLAVAHRRNRHDTLDTTWGLGFVVVAAISFTLGAGHGGIGIRTLATSLTVVWGLRLAIHITLRNRGHGEDYRYQQMRERAGGKELSRLLRAVYLPQAVVLLIVSMPVQAANYTPSVPSGLVIAGSAVWLVGFLFESIGDWQLSRFKANPANKGAVMDRGLWRYTRHPNYFGDACVWWGLYLLACGTWLGVATVIAPALMTFLLAGKTGRPMLEAHLRQKRPEYADYIARTSGFFPLPPRASTH
jgi:steroid 5-alpha reductase family enzyme